MNFPRLPVLSFAATLAMILVNCASLHDEIPPSVLTPDKALTHKDLQIKAWKSPTYVDGLPQTKMEILVSGPGAKPERWVKLRQNKTFEGLTLESVDVRAHTAGNPMGMVTGVITEDFILKVSDADPKPFLIMRGCHAFYSDIAHPPVQ